MDYQSANFHLENAIVELQTGRLYDARQNLDSLLAEAVRFAVKPSERGHAATIAKLTRAAADGGDWRAKAAKAKMYQMAGAKKAGARAHADAHKSTVNPPKYETAVSPRKEPETMPSMKAAAPIGTSAQRNKGRLVGLPTGHGFVDPLDPEVQKRRAATAAQFDKYSSPRSNKESRYSKESVQALRTALAFLNREDKP